MNEKMSKICPPSAKSICDFSVCHRIISQGSTHNNKGARTRCGAPRAPVVVCSALADYSMASRGRAYMVDMSSTIVGTWVHNSCFQEFGPRFLTCPQPVGTWVKHISGIWSQMFVMTHKWIWI